MLVHPNNRPHRVDDETAEFLYALYRFLFASNVSPRIKQRTFETAAESEHQWRVVSISRDAIEHIRTNETANGLQRGHILSRVTRARTLFERPAPMDREELLSYFFEHDTVALVTKEENNRDGASHWSPLLAVPEGLFTAGTFAIYIRKRKELVWVQSLSQQSAA